MVPSTPAGSPSHCGAPRSQLVPPRPVEPVVWFQVTNPPTPSSFPAFFGSVRITPLRFPLSYFRRVLSSLYKDLEHLLYALHHCIHDYFDYFFVFWLGTDVGAELGPLAALALFGIDCDSTHMCYSYHNSHSFGTTKLNETSLLECYGPSLLKRDGL